jgi:hypothetical protein
MRRPPICIGDGCLLASLPSDEERLVRAHIPICPLDFKNAVLARRVEQVVSPVGPAAVDHVEGGGDGHLRAAKHAQDAVDEDEAVHEEARADSAIREDDVAAQRRASTPTPSESAMRAKKSRSAAAASGSSRQL